MDLQLLLLKLFILCLFIEPKRIIIDDVEIKIISGCQGVGDGGCTQVCCAWSNGFHPLFFRWIGSNNYPVILILL